MATILTCYYRAKPGGYCARLFRALQALLEAGHTVHYLSVTPFPIDHPRCLHHRFPWPAGQTDHLSFWACFFVTAPVLLIWLALRHRVSHLLAFGTTYAFLLRPVRWFRAAALTCFVRGDALQAHADNYRQPWVIHLERFVEGLALDGTRVVAVSPHLIDTIRCRQRRAVPMEILILPNDLPSAPARAPRPAGHPLRLAMVGVLVPGKNQGLVIKALHGLKKEGWHLTVYGIGPDVQRLRESTEALGLSGQVVFAGWRPTDQIWSEVDLLLAPSRHEGMPNAVLEAVAHAVPVLASDIAAHRQLLPAAHLLPPGRLPPWREAIAAILGDPDRCLVQMAHDQRVRCRHLLFDWDARVVALVLSSLDPVQD